MALNYEFGPFRLDGKLGILLRGTEPLAVGQRAIALLRLLVERAGKPVTKEDLIAAAWPGLAVEHSNLTVRLSLRRPSVRNP
jgi:DNA-binding winged helix-turn-helix (wHTH) protein